MKKLQILLVMLGICSLAFSQSKKVYKVKPGEKVLAVIPPSETYTYPQFKAAVVLFRTNSVGSAMMNYNSLLGEMEFIGDKGDTLSLNDAITVSHIAIGSDTFYFENGYMRQLQNTGHLKLAVKKLISLSNRQKLGGFGEVASGNGVDTYNSVTLNSNNMKEMVAREILTFTEYTTWYFGDKFNHFVPANKKSLMNLYGNKEQEVEKYLKDNPVNFSKEEDLTRLVGFLKTL